MAKMVKPILLDDVDGSQAASTVQFGYQGVQYEIDLSDENAKKFQELMQPWVDAGRRTGGRRRSGTAVKSKTKAAEIREWAREKGLDVPDRGRIPVEIRERYAQEVED